jgi:hypothetical protein
LHGRATDGAIDCAKYPLHAQTVKDFGRIRFMIRANDVADAGFEGTIGATWNELPILEAVKALRK